MEKLHVAIILLSLSGVFTAESIVKYKKNYICALKGFSVSIPCNYSYKKDIKLYTLNLHWCSSNSNDEEYCLKPPYVYTNTNYTNNSDFEYTGNNISNCSMRIHNVKLNYSGEYKFRYVIDDDKYTGRPGVILQVKEIKIETTSPGENGVYKSGDSVNLTCRVDCNGNSSQFIWLKNNKQLNTVGPVLHLPSLYFSDSATYTCIWRSEETEGFASIHISVKGTWIIVFLIVGLVLVIVVLAGVIFYRRRKVEASDAMPDKYEDETKERNKQHDRQRKPQMSQDPDPNKEELTYASVVIQTNKTPKSFYSQQQQHQDDSVIYSAVIKH